LKDISLHTALDVALEPLGLGWVVRNDALVITSRENADTTLWTRVYSLPLEIGPARQRPMAASLVPPEQLAEVFSRKNLPTPAQEFQDNLEALVGPDSWKDAGGPGSVELVPSRLVVAQTQRRHDELADWLRQLRRAGDPHVVDHDERAT